jgi:hypothetical protein
MRIMDGAAAAGAGVANIDKGAGTGFEHVCKVFGSCDQASIAIDVCLADEIGRRVRNEIRLGRVIDGRDEQSGNSTLAVAPKAAAMAAAVRRMPSSICSMVSLLMSGTYRGSQPFADPARVALTLFSADSGCRGSFRSSSACDHYHKFAGIRIDGRLLRVAQACRAQASRHPSR